MRYELQMTVLEVDDDGKYSFARRTRTIAVLDPANTREQAFLLADSIQVFAEAEAVRMSDENGGELSV